MNHKIFLLVQIILFSGLIIGCREDEEKRPLKACFESPTNVIRNTEVTFNASCSQSAETYHWDLGDGNVAMTQNPTHTFKTDGEFTIKLVVEKNGIKDSITQNIIVNRTDNERNCKPSFIFDANLYPFNDSHHDSVAFSYLDDGRLNDIKWFYSRISKTPDARVQCQYDGSGRLSEFQFLRRKAVNPYAENLITTSFVHYNTLGLPTTIENFRSSGEANGISNYFYDSQNRLIEIVNKYGSGSRKTKYEYYPDGNTYLVFYEINDKPILESNKVARKNIAFDSTVPFYSASKELRLYFEYIVQIEPYRNNFKSSHVYHSMTADGGITYWGDYPTFEGLSLEYDSQVNEKGLVQKFFSNYYTGVVPTEITYQRVEYFCY